MNSEHRKLFIDGLKQMYDAELRQINFIGRLAESSTNPELSHAFAEQLTAAQEHADRIVQIFVLLSEPHERRTSKAMMALIEEGEQLIAEYKVSTAQDAALIFTAQKIEHFEIAVYRRLVARAQQMNLVQVTQLLEDNLQEERDSDSILSDIAETISDLETEAV